MAARRSKKAVDEHGLNARERQFVYYFTEKALTPEEAARKAGYGKTFIDKKLHTLLENDAINNRIAQILSKDGLEEKFHKVYRTYYGCLEAETVPTISATEAKRRAELIEKILDKGFSAEYTQKLIDDIKDQFGRPKPNHQIRMWAVDVGFRIRGEYAASKLELSEADPLAGKSAEEQDKLLQEADKTLKLIEGGKSGKRSA